MSLTCLTVWMRLGDILWQWLESDGGPAGHGPGASSWPDETSDRLPTDLQGLHRRTHPSESQGKERGLLYLLYLSPSISSSSAGLNWRLYVLYCSYYIWRMSRVSVKAQVDVFMSVEMSRNILIFRCDCCRLQWATSKILGQDVNVQPPFELWRKHCVCAYLVNIHLSVIATILPWCCINYVIILLLLFYWCCFIFYWFKKYLPYYLTHSICTDSVKHPRCSLLRIKLN